MGFLDGVGRFLSTSANWSGSDGIVARAAAQLELCAVVIAVAAVIGIGLGFVLGHFGHGGFVAVNAANAARAVPSLALLTLLVIWPTVGLRGDGFIASFITLVALAIPPLLTNAYVAMREVDPDVIESAKAVGMSSIQRFFRVEAPLAVPLAYAGFRTATLEVVATSTLAGYVSYNDLGDFIFAGLNTNNNVESFCGALLVAVLAGLVDLLLLACYRFVSPMPRRRRVRSLRPVAVAATVS